MGGSLIRQQEKEVDVGIGRQLATPIAAHGNDCQPLARSRIGERVDYLGDEIEQRADQLIHEEALLADRCRAVAGRLETATDLGAPCRQSHLQGRDERTAIERGSLERADDKGQSLGQRSAIDDIALPGDAAHDDSLRPDLSPALKASAGIDGDDRGDRVLEMGNASHYREGHITTATLPATARVFSVSLRSSGRAPLTGDVRRSRLNLWA